MKRLSIESVGAAVVNLTGAGISIDSFHRLSESIQANALQEFAISSGESILGVLIVALADEWKKRIWEKNNTEVA